MPRLTITLPTAVYTRLSATALQSESSMSSVINRLISLGMHCASDECIPQKQSQPGNQIEQHCHHLIIQMNALIKNMSVELLKFNQDDFDQLRQAAVIKYNDLGKSHIDMK